MPDFSIIIPVYNVRTFLQECLDSCLAQTEQSWEAVCVDDGSSDGSYEILKSYAAKDARFRVFHQANAGASAARNFALSQAEGDYVTMVDADDALPPNALARYAEMMRENPDSDCLFAGALRLYDSGKTMGVLPAKRSYRKRGCVDVDAEMMSAMSAFCWSKLYRLSIIRENQIAFDDRTSMCEDYQFNLVYLSYCKKVTLIEDVLYLYKMHASSTSSSYHQGTAKLSLYTSYVAVIPRALRMLSAAMDSETRKEWKKELYRKNFHLCFSPISISLRMPLSRCWRVLAAAVCSHLYMMAHVSPCVWLRVFLDDVQLYRKRRNGLEPIGCPFDNPSAHI